MASLISPLVRSTRYVVPSWCWNASLLPSGDHTGSSPAESRRLVTRYLVAIDAVGEVSSVDGLVQAARRASAVEAPGCPAALVHRGIQCVGTLQVDGDIGGAGVLVDEENVVPGLTAVHRFVHAALFVWPP